MKKLLQQRTMVSVTARRCLPGSDVAWRSSFGMVLREMPACAMSSWMSSKRLWSADVRSETSSRSVFTSDWKRGGRTESEKAFFRSSLLMRLCNWDIGVHSRVGTSFSKRSSSFLSVESRLRFSTQGSKHERKQRFRIRRHFPPRDRRFNSAD
jgi:hypothetical protein